MILAIETATDICSVAFQKDGGDIVVKRVEARGSHSEKMFLFIRELMEDYQFSISNLSAIFISEGPGSYTGLRIAASGVKGLLFGSDVPLYSVQTLPSLAYIASQEHEQATKIHAIIDARRVHVYHQAFSIKDDILQPISEVHTVSLDDFEAMIEVGDVIIGTGINRLDEIISENVRLMGIEWISARSLIELYQQPGSVQFINKVDPASFDPKYYTSNQVQ